MSLKIVGGKLCCIVALVPCTSGTTLYSTSNHATVGTVVKYSGACYTVTATTNCGTIVTGPFTVVANCGSCVTYNCNIEDCHELSSAYTVSGFQNVFPSTCGPPPCNTGPNGPGDCCQYLEGTTYYDIPPWGGVLAQTDTYGYGGDCIWTSEEVPLPGTIGGMTSDGCIVATDGTFLTVYFAGITCTACTPEDDVAWVLTIQISSASVYAGSCTPTTYTFVNTSSTPAGTYLSIPATGIPMPGGCKIYPDKTITPGSTQPPGGPSSLLVA